MPCKFYDHIDHKRLGINKHLSHYNLSIWNWLKALDATMLGYQQTLCWLQIWPSLKSLCILMIWNEISMMKLYSFSLNILEKEMSK